MNRIKNDIKTIKLTYDPHMLQINVTDYSFITTSTPTRTTLFGYSQLFCTIYSSYYTMTRFIETTATYYLRRKFELAATSDTVSDTGISHSGMSDVVSDTLKIYQIIEDKKFSPIAH